MAGLLAGKVALVTGGSSGIGKATAIDFAREGAKVVIADIQKDLGLAVVAQIKAAGGEATFTQKDVSKWDQVQAMVKETIDAYGRLDCAFNNAGVEGSIKTPTAQFDVNEWQTVLATDLTGVFLCMKAELTIMADRKSGAIVNMSSIAGMVGDPLIGAAYHASKFGVIGLTRTAAIEYATAGIRINVVCPGFIDTPMVQAVLTKAPALKDVLIGLEPMKRFGQPEEVAAMVTWLCSDRASFVTGASFAVDGGILAG